MTNVADKLNEQKTRLDVIRAEIVKALRRGADRAELTSLLACEELEASTFRSLVLA